MRDTLLQRLDPLVMVRGLSCCVACGLLVPWAGMEPESPALEGGALTTGPPGKSPSWLFHLPLAPPLSGCPWNGRPAHLVPGPLGSLVPFAPLNMSATCLWWTASALPTPSLVLHPAILAPQLPSLRRLLFIWKPFKWEDLAQEREALDRSGSGEH